MKLFLLLLLIMITYPLFCLKAGSENAPVEWQHGWKTDRVIATRYSNPVIGRNVGFKFPKNPNDCDRVELSDFMMLHGGYIYESGGYPGAEMFVVFKGVKDRKSEDAKIKEILPALSKLIKDLGDGMRVQSAGKVPKNATSHPFSD